MKTLTEYRAHYNISGQWFADERTFAKPEEARRYAQGIVDRAFPAIQQFEIRSRLLDSEGFPFLNNGQRRDY